MSFPNNGPGHGYQYDPRYHNTQPQRPPPPSSSHAPSQQLPPLNTQHHQSQPYYAPTYSQSAAAAMPRPLNNSNMIPHHTHQMQYMQQQNRHAYHHQGQYDAPLLPQTQANPQTYHSRSQQIPPYHPGQSQQIEPPRYSTQASAMPDVHISPYTSSSMRHMPIGQTQSAQSPDMRTPHPQALPFQDMRDAFGTPQGHQAQARPYETYIPPPVPRRKSSSSNHNNALAFHEVQSHNTPRTPSSQISHLQSSSSPVLNSRTLVCLAEEFFLEAYKLVSTLSLPLNAASVKIYHKLIATGLGCLEACLLHLELKPRMQALIRLRMAAVMLEETQNSTETESCLSKGIKLCDQHKYFDLQYSMTFLQIRILFKTSQKAALKQLDIAIVNAELYRHYSWVYAMRFLRVELSLQTATPAIRNVAIQHLQSITALSLDRGDRSVHAAAALIEAITYLSLPGIDNTEQANRALASARTYQLDRGSKITQLVFLIHCVDVICSFSTTPRGETPWKLRTMQQFMDAVKDDPSWSSTRSAIAIPVNTDADFTQSASSDSRAIVGVDANGQHLVMLSYLGKQDAMAFTNFLSGVVQMQNKDHEKNKAAQYLNQANMFLADKKRHKQSPVSLPVMLQGTQWRLMISAYARVHQAFCAAIRTQWDIMLKQLQELETLLSHIGEKSSPIYHHYLYLTGVYQQGIGNLDNALAIYSDSRLTLHIDERSFLDPAHRVEQDLSILALLNRIAIMQHSRHADSVLVMEFIDKLEPMCTRHPMEEIQTAFDILKATIQTNPPTSQLQQKNHVKAALSKAAASSNAQFMSVLFNVMCMLFFDGAIGEQAYKSAQTASVWSNKSQNKLWMSVAEGLMAGNYEANARAEEAHAARQKGVEFANAAFGSQKSDAHS